MAAHILGHSCHIASWPSDRWFQGLRWGWTITDSPRPGCGRAFIRKYIDSSDVFVSIQLCLSRQFLTLKGLAFARWPGPAPPVPKHGVLPTLSLQSNGLWLQASQIGRTGPWFYFPLSVLLGRKPSLLLMSSERHSSCFFNPARLQIAKLSVNFDCRLQAERVAISTAASRLFHPSSRQEPRPTSLLQSFASSSEKRLPHFYMMGFSCHFLPQS